MSKSILAYSMGVFLAWTTAALLAGVVRYHARRMLVYREYVRRWLK